jgi:putative transposase
MHANWVENNLKVDKQLHESKWSQSIAVGSKAFVEKIKDELGMRAVHRRTNKVDESFELREEQSPYITNFNPKNAQLSKNNSYYWHIY